jgi:hypothetical protein
MKPQQKGERMKKTLLIITALALVAVACGGDTCTRASYMDAVDPYIQQWDDTADVASQTARMALPNVIAELQQIRRDVAALDVPGCGEEAHGELVAYMDGVIDAYLAFLGQEGENTVAAKFESAGRHLDNWSEELAAIGE